MITSSMTIIWGKRTLTSWRPPQRNMIQMPTLSYRPGKTLGQVITVAEHDQFVSPVIADHLMILELPPPTNESGLVDECGNPLDTSFSPTENLATKFEKGDAVVINPGERTYATGDATATIVRIDKEAVGIVLSKETTEIGTKRYRVYKVLIGLEKLLIMEEFMEPAV